MPLTLTTVSIAGRLKQETYSLHQAPENVLRPKPDSMAGYEDYARILRCFYGFFHTLQTLISARELPACLPDINERKRTDQIASDLLALPVEQIIFPVCNDLHSISNEATAPGALHVHEGSKPGRRMIGKMLMKQGLLRPVCLRFFNGYGEGTGKKWNRFREVLNYYEGSAKELIGSATDTRWMNICL
jgi:heme oxygenase